MRPDEIVASARYEGEDCKISHVLAVDLDWVRYNVDGYAYYAHVAQFANMSKRRLVNREESHAQAE